MAYAIEYYYQFYDAFNNTLHRIELWKNGFGGAAAGIGYAAATPITIRHTGGGKDNFEDTIIQGQELLFSFMVAQDDVATFEDIFENPYKTYKVKYWTDYSGDSSFANTELEFEGYLKPENYSRHYTQNPPYIEFKMSATDALADLKRIEFKDSVTENLIIGKYTLFEIIKYALDNIGISLDFKVQLNTYEHLLMNANECALDKIKVNGDRFFTRNEKGNEVMNCWDVIEAVLCDFNVTFKQYRGFYYIVCYNELDSKEYEFDYATLTQQSHENTDNIVDASAYNFHIDDPEQQKIHPLKKVDLLFRNRDTGEDLTGVDLTDWENSWDIYFDDSDTSGDPVILTSESRYEGSLTNNYVTLASAFSVTKYTENDFLKIYFNYRISGYGTTGPQDVDRVLHLRVDVVRPNGTIKEGWRTLVQSSTNWCTFTSDTIPEYNIPEQGDYNIIIRLIADWGTEDEWDWDEITFEIKNVSITQLVDPANSTYNPLEEQTYPIFYTPAGGVGLEGFDVFEKEILLADGGQTSEVGAFFVGSTVTSSWNTYLNTENESILSLYSKIILNNRSTYKNFLRFTLIDRENTIGFNNIITLDSKNYVFNSFSRDSKLGEIKGELIELITYDESYATIEDAEEIKFIYQGTNQFDPYIHQIDHGFIVGDVVGIVEGEYVLADARPDSNGDYINAVGMVSDVSTDDTFKFINDGYIPLDYFDSGIVIGSEQRLDPDNAGQITDDPTFAENDNDQVVAIVTTLGVKVEIGTLKVAYVPVDSAGAVEGEYFTVRVVVDSEGRITEIESGEEDITFDYNDVVAGIARTFVLDPKASFDYTIISATLETNNGTLTGVNVKIGAVAVTSLSSVTVDTTATEIAATGNNDVDEDDRVTISVTTGYTGAPTQLLGKITIMRR